LTFNKEQGARNNKQSLITFPGLQTHKNYDLMELNPFHLSLPGQFRVAVVLSTYNQPLWLTKCLWGYVEQSFDDFEILIADDGSGPETKGVVRDFQEQSGLSIRHIWQPDEGFRKCRILNKAIMETDADYLIFSDGDCIPRMDFVGNHVRHARPGYFLSGGYLKLNENVSGLITRKDVVNQRPFSARWLMKHGMSFSHKYMKLVRNPAFTGFMNRVTTTRTTWNGHNVSGWKSDLLKVNGYNESMNYGGLDRELGERLVNAGLKGQQIRYYAICVHLDHARPYKTRDALNKNMARRLSVKSDKLTWTPDGILKDGGKKQGKSS